MRAEAASLEKVLKNQAHPKNLVAIKKSGTPVVATSSLNAKTLFLASARGAPVAADLFQVTREETASFPGDWEPLRGRNVKIISVQKIQENEKAGGAQAKLEFAKSLLDKTTQNWREKSQELSGVALIFDSVDGGMIAATLPTVQAWKAGTLSDAALRHQCYFDPPETFSIASPPGGR